MVLRAAGRRLLLLSATLLLGGLLAATLVRWSPGFGADARELDPRLSAQTLRALRQASGAQQSVVEFYFRYLRGMLKGDLGMARSLDRPVAELLARRAPLTARWLLYGITVGWAIGLALAIGLTLKRRALSEAAGLACSGLLLCLPSALLALLALLLGASPAAALAVVVFPRVFRYARNLLSQAARREHVLAARAAGLGPGALVVRCILPEAAPGLIALAGVTVNLALGAAVPVEVVCDSPGIGQLAWNAALARDLPLLVNLTMVVTAVTLLVNLAADLAVAALGGRR